MLNRNELIVEGLAYTVMGVMIVFLILVIIMLVIKAMALFSVEKKSVVEKVEITETAVPQVVEEKTDESELIAVISAAIAAATENVTTDFVVRSYKKVSGGVWNKAGRRDVLENRF